MTSGRSPDVSRTARQWRLGEARARPIVRATPRETAVGIAYDSRPYVVVMASPTDVEDLARGFTVSEQVAPFGSIQSVRVTETPDGLLADVLLDPLAGTRLAKARRRTLESRSSCGLCGVETLREAMRPIATVGPGPRVTRAAIQRALGELEAGQALGDRTRATHAAAWADATGAVSLVREDVGRHNALDKAVGAALAAGLDANAAMIIVTSRCSYEMVEKTAAAGVSILVAISAPTDLAITKAEACGLTLIALARGDGHTVFTGPERVLDP